MSNARTTHFGGGQSPGFRSLGVGRGAIVLWLVFGMLVSASIASIATAAEIVEVRVGRHPEFTRVVFELDRAVGYRIERTSPDSETAELVVSLEATSIPRSIQSSKSMIEQVAVESVGNRSVARIRLSKGGLRLKEMILASPPRIVLDVMSDRPVTAPVARKAAPKPKPAEESFDDIVAKATPPPAPAPIAEPDPEPTIQNDPELAAEIESELAADLAAAEAAEEAAAEAAANDAANEAADSAADTAAYPRTNTREPFADAVADPSESADAMEMADESAISDAEAMLAEMEGNFADLQPGDTIPAPTAAPTEPAPMKPANRPTPRPMVVQTRTDEGGGWLKMALIGVGVIVLLVGGLFVVRKRGGGSEIDFSDDADEAGFDDDTVVSDAEENPFGDLADNTDASEAVLGTPDDPTVAMMMDEEDTTIVSIPDEEEKESESVVFADSEENVMDDMEVISRDQVNESLGGEAMPPVVGGIPEEFQQMMREMSRRVEALEGRVDELVDARDRLERQVAAQTEELRVQRAAIARTQRAVRNLARPEDEAGADEPTEPALRDPNQPSPE